jgi:hypothetical protein
MNLKKQYEKPVCAHYSISATDPGIKEAISTEQAKLAQGRSALHKPPNSHHLVFAIQHTFRNPRFYIGNSQSNPQRTPHMMQCFLFCLCRLFPLPSFFLHPFFFFVISWWPVRWPVLLFSIYLDSFFSNPFLKRLMASMSLIELSLSCRP